MSDDDVSLTVEMRLSGRMHRVEVFPSGSASVSRDGMWLFNANWSGRTLDCGTNTFADDPDRDAEMLATIVAAIEGELAKRPGFTLDPRKKGARQ